MKTLFALLSILLVALVLPVSAAKKGKGPHQDGSEARITAVGPASITVSLGKSGDEIFEYKINEQTKVTLNGAPITARDLRAGMVCKVEADANHVATSIAAKDAPAHPSKHRVG
jgi:hypothetical protein